MRLMFSGGALDVSVSLGGHVKCFTHKGWLKMTVVVELPYGPLLSLEEDEEDDDDDEEAAAVAALLTLTSLAGEP
jgi:hypothetical protein